MQVQIRRSPWDLNTQVWLYDIEGDNLTSYNIREDGMFIAHRSKLEGGVSVMDSQKPTMLLNEQTARELLCAFVEAARMDGIKHAKESESYGKLMATERHLSDLRQMLKLK